MVRLVVIFVTSWILTGHFAFASGLNSRTLECLRALTVARPDFAVNAASTTLSQRLRDNAPDYWAYVHRLMQSPDQMGLTGDVLTSVIAVGDGHPGNFAPLETEKGQLVYSLYDIKSLGVSPAILDANQAIINTLAVAHARSPRYLAMAEMKALIHDLFGSYISGLLVQDFTLTLEHQGDMPNKLDYLRIQEARWQKVTDKKGLFKIDSEDLLPVQTAASSLNLSVPDLKQQLEQQFKILFGDGRLVDAATRPVERGGSKNNLRIWVNYQLTSGAHVFRELKAISFPATASYQSQSDFLETIREASTYLDYDILAVSPVIEIAGTRFFVRNRKVESLPVPYRQRDEADFKNLLRLSRSTLRWIGTWHSRQLRKTGNFENYTQSLIRKIDAVEESLTHMDWSYLVSIEWGGQIQAEPTISESVPNPPPAARAPKSGIFNWNWRGI